MSNLENLTDTERLILANQYEILSKLEDKSYGSQYRGGPTCLNN